MAKLDTLVGDFGKQGQLLLLPPSLPLLCMFVFSVERSTHAIGLV